MRRLSQHQLLGWAWLALALALGVHVADEASHDFLAVYNPSAQAMRDRLGLPFPPVFSFRVWLGGLIVAVAALLAFTRLAFAGSRALAWLGLALGILMVGNGALHIVGSVVYGRLMPGVLSAPLLLACAVLLIIATLRVLRSRASA